MWYYFKKYFYSNEEYKPLITTNKNFEDNKFEIEYNNKKLETLKKELEENTKELEKK